MAAIIVDGISASGKSFLLRALKRMSDDSSPNFTKLYLTEHLTERFFEQNLPPRLGIHEHVARILRLAGELQAIKAASPFSSNKNVVTIIIERLFLTLLSRELMNESFFDDHAELLNHVELKSVLLVIPEALIEERIARSMGERNQGWHDYIERLGGLRGATAHFLAQQERMLQANKFLTEYIASEVVEVVDVEMLSDNHLLGRLL